MRRACAAPVTVPLAWLKHLARELFGPRGYLFIGSVVSAYLVIFTLVLGQHDRESTRAAAMMSNFFSLTSSNAANFTFGTSMTATVAKMPVMKEPKLLSPSTWWTSTHMPNAPWIVRWLVGVSSKCQPGSCGQAEKPYRGDMSGADFSFLILSTERNVDGRNSGFDHPVLDDMILNQANLRSTQAGLSSFARASLRNSNLYRLYAEGSDFTGTDLTQANMEGAKVGAMRHDDNYSTSSRFAAAKLRATKARCASFSAAHMQGADLSSLASKDVTWKENRISDFRWADFTYADLEGADLQDARFEGADFTDAKMKGAKLRGARYDSATRFPPGVDRSEMYLSADEPQGARTIEEACVWFRRESKQSDSVVIEDNDVLN